jgi:hypothetical protein
MNLKPYYLLADFRIMLEQPFSGVDLKNPPANIFLRYLDGTLTSNSLCVVEIVEVSGTIGLLRDSLKSLAVENAS